MSTVLDCNVLLVHVYVWSNYSWKKYTAERQFHILWLCPPLFTRTSMCIFDEVLSTKFVHVNNFFPVHLTEMANGARNSKISIIRTGDVYLPGRSCLCATIKKIKVRGCYLFDIWFYLVNCSWFYSYKYLHNCFIYIVFI